MLVHSLYICIISVIKAMNASRICSHRNHSSNLLQVISHLSCLQGRSSLSVASAITSRSSSYAGQLGWEGQQLLCPPQPHAAFPGLQPVEHYLLDWMIHVIACLDPAVCSNLRLKSEKESYLSQPLALDKREQSFFNEKLSQGMNSAPSRTECACYSTKHITHKTCVSSGI